MNMKENDRGKTEEEAKTDVLDEGSREAAAHVLPQPQHGMVRDNAGLLGGSVQEEGVAPGPQEDKEVYAGLGTRVSRQMDVADAKNMSYCAMCFGGWVSLACIFAAAGHWKVAAGHAMLSVVALYLWRWILADHAEEVIYCD